MGVMSAMGAGCGIGPAIAKRDTALGRIAEAEEVAELVAWLCSPKASYITCTTMDVSAGR